MLKTDFAENIFSWFFDESWKGQHLFKTEIFCSFINILNDTFD